MRFTFVAEIRYRRKMISSVVHCSVGNVPKVFIIIMGVSENYSIHNRQVLLSESKT